MARIFSSNTPKRMEGCAHSDAPRRIEHLELLSEVFRPNLGSEAGMEGTVKNMILSSRFRDDIRGIRTAGERGIQSHLGTPSSSILSFAGMRILSPLRCCNTNLNMEIEE